MSPVKFSNVKSFRTTLELFGRSALPALPWSTYCWLMKTGKVTLWILMFDQVTLLQRPCPPTQDLKRAAYKPPATLMRSKRMLDTLAKLLWSLPREPIERPGQRRISGMANSWLTNLGTHRVSDIQ